MEEKGDKCKTKVLRLELGARGWGGGAVGLGPE